ncbi:MAG TPA: GtrA family protein [Clostridia bacterium]|nr:GtrA family protein [Clostridia bacterium]
MKKETIATFWQFIKFNIVGVLNTLVDIGVYALLTMLGLNQYVAQVISYTCGVLNSYLFNTLWTFRREKRRTAREFIAFLCVNLVSLGVSLGIIYVAEHYLHVEGKLLQKLIATPVAMLVNFAGNKLFVFNKTNPECVPEEPAAQTQESRPGQEENPK